MKAILRAIEHWASVSQERTTLLIILVWAAMGLIAALSFLTAVWVMVPDSFKLL